MRSLFHAPASPLSVPGMLAVSTYFLNNDDLVDLQNIFDTVYSCEDMAEDQHTTVSDLVTWNPWIGTVSSCNEGIYANMSEAETDRPVCVEVKSALPISSSTTIATTSPATTTTPATTATTTTTTSSSVAAPGPTQAGIVDGCRKYHIAVEGDGCWAIADANKVELDSFYSWNPARKNPSFSHDPF